MHDLLEFLKGLALLVFIGAVVTVPILAFVARDSPESFDWLVLLGPLLPLFSRMGFHLVERSNRFQTPGQVRSTSRNRFRSTRAALDHLAERIAAEAEREGNPLSEIEREMLYFSESSPTLPQMKAVDTEFDDSWDEDAFEQRISCLAKKIRARDAAQDHTAQALWDEAVEKVADGDYYLSVLVSPSHPGQDHSRPAHDKLKLWLTAFALVIGCMTIFWLGSLLFGNRF